MVVGCVLWLVRWQVGGFIFVNSLEASQVLKLQQPRKRLYGYTHRHLETRETQKNFLVFWGFQRGKNTKKNTKSTN